MSGTFRCIPRSQNKKFTPLPPRQSATYPRSCLQSRTRDEVIELKLLTTVDVSRRAGLTTDGIRKAVRTGKLRAQRAESGVFVYREADVERWLERRRRLAAAAVVASSGDAA